MGGAFDPPHLGHVALAREGMSRFGLTRLHVRVVAEPGHKDVSADADVRLELACRAFADVRGVDVSLDPYPRTVDSLEALALDDPVFLVGADEFADFLTWKDPAGVLEQARLGVATRPGTHRHVLDEVVAALERPDRVVFFPIEPLEVSSSAVRARVAAGLPVDGLVPSAVAEAIVQLGLYADA
jgi:nicotinate-nucleotide adenylyltransferase